LNKFIRIQIKDLTSLIQTKSRRNLQDFNHLLLFFLQSLLFHSSLLIAISLLYLSKFTLILCFLYKSSRIIYEFFTSRKNFEDFREKIESFHLFFFPYSYSAYCYKEREWWIFTCLKKCPSFMPLINFRASYPDSRLKY
jgi:hypothetical protein